MQLADYLPVKSVYKAMRSVQCKHIRTYFGLGALNGCKIHYYNVLIIGLFVKQTGLCE